MGHRRKARQVALQVLYQIDVAEVDTGEALALYWQCFNAPKNVRKFASQLVTGVMDNIVDVDQLVKDCSEHWSMSRMARVDRNILRMATYELFYCKDIPPKVTINEAIDLGKEFGSENSSSFINGILDALFAQMRIRNDEDNGNSEVDR